jgi:hypothetical protein
MIIVLLVIAPVLGQVQFNMKLKNCVYQCFYCITRYDPLMINIEIYDTQRTTH